MPAGKRASCPPACREEVHENEHSPAAASVIAARAARLRRCEPEGRLVVAPAALELFSEAERKGLAQCMARYRQKDAGGWRGGGAAAAWWHGAWHAGFGACAARPPIKGPPRAAAAKREYFGALLAVEEIADPTHPAKQSGARQSSCTGQANSALLARRLLPAS